MPDLDQAIRTYNAVQKLITRWREMAALGKVLPDGSVSQPVVDTLNGCANALEATLNEKNERK